jgi:tRNA A37 threonylcarbamoyladenosine dehydratase
MERFQRTIKLIGKDAFQKLQEKTVIVLGIGGVGSFAVEALVRSGIGNIVLIDKDVYEESNINRQWPANVETIGKNKVDIVSQECLKISPTINISFEKICLTASNLEDVITKYLVENVLVVDAIDDIKTKVILIHYLKKHNVSFISSMGAANVNSIDSIRYGNLDKTTHCPIAKILRKELGLLGVKNEVPVVYSNQERLPRLADKGSVMSITASFGLRLAQWVIDSCSE